jgi:hypothetical protein
MPNQPSRRNAKSLHNAQVFRVFSAQIYPLNSTKTHKNKKPDAPVEGTTDRSPVDASAALDRIEIPPDVVARISQLLTPGSSLIVSDYGLSRETGNDTDFIVVVP